MSGGMVAAAGTRLSSKQECGGGRAGAGASLCGGVRRAVGISGSDGTQERQRHSGSLSSLRSVSIPGAARGVGVIVLGVCEGGGSSERGVAT